MALEFQARQSIHYFQWQAGLISSYNYCFHYFILIVPLTFHAGNNYIAIRTCRIIPGISGLIREGTDKSSTATTNCRRLPDRFTAGFHVFACLSSVSHTVQAEFNGWEKGCVGPGLVRLTEIKYLAIKVSMHTLIWRLLSFGEVNGNAMF